ncbi:MAG: GAF domain-containing protein [Elusimicrobia bacterium]|nr:GAF domain-containing protein [Elusimicrobiota bacterium]
MAENTQQSKTAATAPATAGAAPAPSAQERGAGISTALELFEIANSLNATLDLDALLMKIGAAAEKLLDSEASSTMLVTDDKKSLYFKVASGDKSKALKSMLLPIGQGIGGSVAKNRKPEIVNDCQKDPRFAGKFDKASGFVTRSILAVHMEYRSEVVGVVEVLNKRSGPYTDSDLKLLQSLASLASVAITNTKIMADQKNFFSHTLEIMGAVIETAKPAMTGHPMRSAKLACAIGRILGMDEYEYRMLYYAGILHDVGYVAFNNPAVLSDFGVVKAAEELHPTMSVKMLEGIRMIEGALPMIQSHHERFDGTGYPSKLYGEAIPLGARILRLTECMEEIRMVGLKAPDLYPHAVKEAEDGKGTSFDPKVVEAFVELMKQPESVW